jgi:hypothetical protein
MYHGRGMTWEEVGKELGYTGGAVHRWAQGYGIESRNPRPLSAETKAKLSAAKTGASRAPMSERARRNLSEGLKGHPVSEAQRAWEREHFKGRTFSAETRARMSEAQKKNTLAHTPEMNRKRSETMKQHWEDPTMRGMWETSCARRRGRNSGTFGRVPPLSASATATTVTLPDGQEFSCRSRAEADFATALCRAGIAFDYESRTFDLRSMEATYTPDFYLPDRDLYVEIGRRQFKGYTGKAPRLAALAADYPEVRLAVIERDVPARLLAGKVALEDYLRV